MVTRLREQLYDRLSGDRTRIVLLGEPGAGKTAASPNLQDVDTANSADADMSDHGPPLRSTGAS